MAALMQKAKLLETGKYKKPDVSGLIPEGSEDAVQRVVAAGMKVMYSPDTREELMAEVQRDVPLPQKLAESVTGLMLTLDQQASGGIPIPAVFPAAMELLGEACEVMSASGQECSQADFNEAAQTMFVLMARKMGANDDQIMQTAQQAAGAMGEGEAPAEEAEMAEQPDPAMAEEAAL